MSSGLHRVEYCCWEEDLSGREADDVRVWMYGFDKKKEAIETMEFLIDLYSMEEDGYTLEKTDEHMRIMYKHDDHSHGMDVWVVAY